MREIETQAITMKTTSRALRPLAPAVAVLLALMQGACGGGATGPSAIAGPEERSSLSGTWRGGSANESLVWQLTQVGDTITGSSSGGRWTGNGGNVVGTLFGSIFKFHESHPVGTTSVPGCSVEVEGILLVSSFQVGRSRAPDDPPGGSFGDHEPPTIITRMQMSGSVSGRTCGGDFNTVVTLYKD